MENLAGIALMITALTGVCNFLLNLGLTWQARSIKTKADKIDSTTAGLVTQTNSLVDKAIENTDAIARAEGRAEVLATLIVPVDPAAASAEIIDKAADKLAGVIAAGISPRKDS